jgi:MSHA biogenesis protein MshI
MWQLLQKFYLLIRPGFKKTEPLYTLVLTIQNEEIVFAYFEPESYLLRQYGSTPFVKTEPIEITLAKLIQEKKLRLAKCIYVLPVTEYQLLLVNKPDTPDEELKTSIRWVIKDFIEQSIDTLTVDYFLLPKNADQKQKLYVASAETEKIKKINQLIRHAGLTLKQITIPELALLNLCNPMEGTNDCIAFLLRTPQKTFIMIMENQNIHLIRTLKSTNETELCEEINRTFDYYHLQLQHSAPQKLILDPSFIESENLIKKLSTELKLPVESIDLNKAVNAIPPIEKAEQSRYLSLIGAGLKTAQQSVNLGDSITKTEIVRFSFAKILLLFSSLVFLLLSISSYHILHFYSLKSTANQITKKKNNLTTQINSLTKKYISLSEVVGSGGKENAPANISKKLALDNILKNYVQPNLQKKRFSFYLTSLAETILPSVWLEKIRVENNINLVSLQGYANTTDNIMDFSKKLNETDLFKDFHLRPFDIKKSKEGSAFSFTIETEKKESPLEETR